MDLSRAGFAWGCDLGFWLGCGSAGGHQGLLGDGREARPWPITYRDRIRWLSRRGFALPITRGRHED